MSKTKIFQYKNDRHLSHKQVKNKRRILSFLLFIFIVIFSTCISGGIGISNQKGIASALLESSYINSLTNDIKQYSNDLCDEAGLPKDVTDESIKYNAIYELEKSYIYSALIETAEYNENAFLANVLHLKDDVKKALNDSLLENGIVIDKEIENNIELFSTKVSNYTKERIRFENEQMFVEILNTSKIVNTAFVFVCVLASTLIIARLLSLGHKKYRSARYIIYSFSGAAVYNLISNGVFNIVKASKPPIIQPSYLQGAIDSYISSSSLNFVLLSMLLLFVSVCIATISWKLKREDI